MYELLIPLLAFVGTVALGGALVAARAARAEPVEARLRGLESPAVEASRRRSWLQDLLGRLGKTAASGGTSQTLREELARAGYHNDAAPMIYLGAKLLLGGVGLIVLMLLIFPTQATVGLKLSSVLLGAGILFFLPNMFVSMRRRQRRLDIRCNLPNAVDMLEICVSAGLGLDMAWNIVSDEIRRVSPTLADEMALTNLEIHLGAPRVEAMRHLAERTGVAEIGSLVAVLVQSERFGTSIGDALRSFALSMRETRGSAAEEAAERMAVRLIFPMVLFVFPAIFVVTVGPAAVTIVSIFSRR